MENEQREKQRKSYVSMRMIYDIGMGSFILLIGLMMLFGDKININGLSVMIADMDPNLRYIFGGLCLLYAGFRLYRGIKHEY